MANLAAMHEFVSGWIKHHCSLRSGEFERTRIVDGEWKASPLHVLKIGFIYIAFALAVVLAQRIEIIGTIAHMNLLNKKNRPATGMFDAKINPLGAGYSSSSVTSVTPSLQVLKKISLAISSASSGVAASKVSVSFNPGASMQT